MFVTFEGMDGSGKTTQVERLRAALEAEGREVVTAREPGQTELGEAIRNLVLHGGPMTPWAEALLYAASRAEVVAEVVRPALERGADVLLDRYLDSSIVYQGIGRGLGVDEVLELNLHATHGLLPDATVLLLLDADTAAVRAGESDRLEREGDDFRRSVDAAYRELAERFPDRIVTIDATGDPEAIAREVRERLRDRS
jgi:dTMP kinase